MDWFNFWFNGISLAAQGSLQMYFSGRFTGKAQKPWYFAGYLALLYTSASFPSPPLATILVLLALYGANRFFLGNSRSVSSVATILAGYVSWLSTGVSNSLTFLLFPNVPVHVFLGYLLACLAMLGGLALCLFCYWLITKLFSLETGLQEPYIWMLLPPGLFFFAVELYILKHEYGSVLVVPYPVETGKQLSLLAFQILGLGALFCALYAYQRTCDGFKAMTALTALEQETHAQKTYVAQAQLRYGRTQAFRHDIKNHLTVLAGLLKTGDYDRAQGYLKKLETIAGGLSFPACTGHPVVDILLEDKLALAQASGVKAEVSLTLPNSCQVNDLDLCIIFANAIDNAIQACMQGDGPQLICINGTRQGSFYMLEFENTCADRTALKMGVGLSNIKAVAEKYGGAITIEKSPFVFRLNVLLDISIQPDSHSRQNP